MGCITPKTMIAFISLFIYYLISLYHYIIKSLYPWWTWTHYNAFLSVRFGLMENLMGGSQVDDDVSSMWETDSHTGQWTCQKVKPKTRKNSTGDYGDCQTMDVWSPLSWHFMLHKTKPEKNMCPGQAQRRPQPQDSLIWVDNNLVHGLPWQTRTTLVLAKGWVCKCQQSTSDWL